MKHARIAFVVAIACCLMGAAPIAPEQPAAAGQAEQIASQLNELRAAERVRELQRAERAAKREADDLAAQQSMAKSTEEISRLTETQIWLGFATLAGLLVTVYFGRRTISQSALALEENRRFSEMELRSYIGPFETICTNVVAGKRPEIKTRLRNFGKTPAYNLRSATHASWDEVIDLDAEIQLPDRFVLRPHFSTVMPEGTASTTAFGPTLTEDMIAKLNDHQAGFQVAVVVIYQDAFGDEHMMKSGMMFFGPKLKESGVIAQFEHQKHIDFPETAKRSPEKGGKMRRAWRELRR